MGHVGPKNGTSLQLWIDSKNFFKILQNERGMKILLVVFFRKKNHLGQFDLFSFEAILYCLIGHGQIKPDHC